MNNNSLTKNSNTMHKRLILTLTLIVLLFRVEAHAAASKEVLPLKIGYADMDYIFGLLPESKRVESEFLSFRKQLVSQMEAKGREYQQKGQALKKGYASMTEAVRNKKERELQQLGASIQQIQQEAEQKLANKQANLLKPLYEKIQSMIEQVAKAQGYTHVFSTNAGGGGAPVLLYATEEHNISDLVLKKLGVKPSKGKKKK